MDESNLLMTNGGQMTIPVLESKSVADAQEGVMLYTSATLVSSAATMSGVVMAAKSKNILYVYHSGLATDISIVSGAKVYVKGGQLEDSALEGTIEVTDGGVMIGGTPTINAEDSLSIKVSNGGLITNCSGLIKVTIGAGGVASNAAFGADLTIQSGGTATKVTMNGYTTIASGANATNMYIGEGGQLARSACVVNGLRVYDGGMIEGGLWQNSDTTGYISELTIAKYITITGVARDLHTSSTEKVKPSIYLADGAAIYDSVVDTGNATLYAQPSSKGSIVKDCTAKNGGTIIISSGVTAINTTVAEGGVVKFTKGAIIKGYTVEAGYGEINMLKSAEITLDFDLSYYTGSFLVNDLSAIGALQRQKPKSENLYYTNYNINYTITLADVNAGGVYKLVSGLTEDFGLLDGKTFTVYSYDGTLLGTMDKTQNLELADGTKLHLATNVDASDKTGKTYELDLTISGVETASLDVTISTNTVNPHDGQISLKEAIGYAQQGVVSQQAGHVGESYISLGAGVENIDLASVNFGNGVTMDLAGAAVTLSDNLVVNETMNLTVDSVSKNYKVGVDPDTKYACNGFMINNGTATLDGASVLTVDAHGDVFNGIVVGGGIVGAHGSYIQTGAAYTTVTNGVFNKSIYGGAAGLVVRYSNNTRVSGTCLTIDATNALTINGDIIGGGFGTSRVLGNSQVIFTGSKLTFTGSVVGDSSNATRTGIYDEVNNKGRYVQGDRIITFNVYSGSFNASNILAFDTAQFQGSSVNFVNANVDFSGVKNWDFADGATILLTDGIGNDFTGDSFDVYGTYGAGVPLIDANSAEALTGFDAMSGVTLFGETASWNSEASAWATASYALVLDANNSNVLLMSIA